MGKSQSGAVSLSAAKKQVTAQLGESWLKRLRAEPTMNSYALVLSELQHANLAPEDIGTTQEELKELKAKAKK